MKKRIAAEWFCRSGLRQLVHRTARWSGVLGLNYHRIGDGQGSLYDRGLWSADAESFAAQMRFCRQQLEIISPADLPQVLQEKRGRYAIVTFDDGYRDNYEVAFPILQHEGVPATFFVASGFIDTPTLPWWDDIAWMVRSSRHSGLVLAPWLDAPLPFDEPQREAAIATLLRRYKTMAAETTQDYLNAIAVAAGTGRCVAPVHDRLWMTWDMLRKMRSAGMTIGGHTVTHPVLARMTTQEQQHEILECGRRLAQELGEPMQCFSYPVGNASAFDAASRASLREAGVAYAFSYYGGYRRYDDWDDYDVRRVAIEPEVSADWFRSIITLPQVFS